MVVVVVAMVLNWFRVRFGCCDGPPEVLDMLAVQTLSMGKYDLVVHEIYRVIDIYIRSKAVDI